MTGIRQSSVSPTDESSLPRDNEQQICKKQKASKSSRIIAPSFVRPLSSKASRGPKTQCQDQVWGGWDFLKVVSGESIRGMLVFGVVVDLVLFRSLQAASENNSGSCWTLPSTCSVAVGFVQKCREESARA